MPLRRPGAADLADHEVRRDAEEPRVGVVRRPPRRDLADEPDERFLEHVLGGLVIAGRGADEPEQGEMLGLVDLDDRVGAARGRRRSGGAVIGRAGTTERDDGGEPGPWRARDRSHAHDRRRRRCDAAEPHPDAAHAEPPPSCHDRERHSRMPPVATTRRYTAATPATSPLCVSRERRSRPLRVERAADPPSFRPAVPAGMDRLGPAGAGLEDERRADEHADDDGDPPGLGLELLHRWAPLLGSRSSGG